MSDIRPEEFDLCRQMKDMILASAQCHQWAPEIVAGILSRESRFGLLLQNGLGGAGHGHGLMQIDDRSFGPWLASHDWTDPATNIEQGVIILTEKYNYLSDHTELTGADLEQAAVAAYNCGEGNVRQVVEAGDDIDSRTTGHDYSADVLDRAAQFKEIFA